MQLLMRSLRHDRSAIAGKTLLVLALMGAGAAGWMVLFSNDQFTVEGRIHDVGTGDPVTAQLDIRITNHQDRELRVEVFSMQVWANRERTVLLVEQEVRGLEVAPKGQVERTYELEFQNADAFGASVWVDAHTVFYIGADRHEEARQGLEVSVGAALGKIM
jgi:hypothetical protein